jgi:hypothetical protein
VGEGRFDGGRGGDRQQRGLVGAVLVDGLHECRQLGEPVSNPLMHVGGDLPVGFAAPVGVAAPHRARRRPPGTGGILHRPFLDVEVERADSGEDLEVAEAAAFSAGAVRAGEYPCPLFPCFGYLRRQVQSFQVGVVAFDVGPEDPDEHCDEIAERVVVERGSAFVEVAHQQRSNVAVAQLVLVHDLGGGSLPDPDGFLQGRARAQVGDAARQHPGQTDAGPAAFAKAPRSQAEYVVSGEFVDVAAGVHDHFRDRFDRFGSLLARDRQRFGSGVDLGEQIRAERLPTLLEQCVGLVGVEKPVAGQHDPALQQAGHAAQQPFSFARVREIGAVHGDQSGDPFGAIVGSGGDPPPLPPVTGKGVQPFEDRSGTVDLVALARIRGARPDGQQGEPGEDFVDGQMIERADAVGVDEFVVSACVRDPMIVAAVSGQRRRLHHRCPSSTASASAS